jgi:hypothetical protein
MTNLTFKIPSFFNKTTGKVLHDLPSGYSVHGRVYADGTTQYFIFAPLRLMGKIVLRYPTFVWTSNYEDAKTWISYHAS